MLRVRQSAAILMPSQGQGKRRLTPQDIPVKRFRVSRACDQCRTAREKCDGNQPTCLPCVEGKRPCTYTSNPKKRGLQPGYIRGLEMTLAFVFQHNPDIENLVNTQLAQEHTILLARGTKDSNRLHKSWTKSKFCRDITRALAGEHIDSGDEKVPSSDDESDIDVEDASLSRMVMNTQPHDEVKLPRFDCCELVTNSTRYHGPTTPASFQMFQQYHSYPIITALAYGN